MFSSPHSRYRKQLQALRSDVPLVEAVRRSLQPESILGQQLVWTRMYERFSPGEAPYASLVLAATSHTSRRVFQVEVFGERPVDDTNQSWVARDEQLGWVRILRFPSDGVLDTLTAVLAEHATASVVQYWPGHRCTLRIQADGRTYFVKTYPKKYLRQKRGQHLYDVALALWHASCRGELPFQVARPVRWDDETRTLWLEQLPGLPWDAQGTANKTLQEIHQIGRCAAALAGSAINPFRVFDGKEQLVDSIAYGAELGRRIPRIAPVIHELIEGLQAVHRQFEGRRLRPVHGDMHPGQWLQAQPQSQLGLLDFDDFSLGDLERDAGFFLVQMQSEYAPSAQPVVAAECFVAGYESIAGPLGGKLLHAYMAHKWLSKALKAARALRPHGDLLAKSCLQNARAVLAGDMGFRKGAQQSSAFAALAATS